MERLGPYLRLLAGRAPGSDPEDLGQETAARALRLGGSLRPGAPLVPWLRRIALRVHLDALARRRPEVEFHDGVPEPRVEDPTLRLEERERCEVLLARLAAREREVLERFHRREHSIARIASDLCLPEGTVKSLLHRARRRLAASDPPSRP